ncbi:MAG: hypothetical protein H6733_10665 [Alphaproteobacteria bacterium]|nr:hypothetical protein [Alphaproteobacteria bacterium]
MRAWRWILGVALAWPLVASARFGTSPDDRPVSAERAQRQPVEVIVYGDPFARWDGTRWLVHTQVGMPVPYSLLALRNRETEVVAIDTRFVMACEKTWRTGDHRFEVDCALEDVSLQVAPYRNGVPDTVTTRVVTELIGHLRGGKLQIIVGDDGRILDIGLTSLEDRGEEQAVALRQQARSLLARSMLGFQLKLPGPGRIQGGQWVEYDSPLFDLPTTTRTEGLQSEWWTPRKPVTVNGLGSSYIVHQLDRYQGRLVVQSLGEAAIGIGDTDKGNGSIFQVSMDGVAVFDEGTGVLTERVWAFRGRASSGSSLSDGRVSPYYFNTGRFTLLGEDDHPALPPSGVVGAPGATERADTPSWPAFL